MNSVVIIGAGHAAAEAILTLRKNGWTGKIILVGEETSLPYQRPPLSKAYFQKTISEDRLLIRNTAFYQSNEVTLHLGERAISIDRINKILSLSSGKKIQYSNLIIATGTRTRQLSCQGSDISKLYYLKTKNDVEKIQQGIDKNCKLLIIGAGYIGLEVAASSVKQNIKVTIVEASPRVLSRVTSTVISEFYQQLHKKHGVDIHLNTQLDYIEKATTGYNAVMTDGRKLNFDALIVGIGVLPNMELAQEADLECDNGIVVNEYCQTKDEHIYAVGDCSNHPSFIYNKNIRLESVPNAVGQAKVAALAICDQKVAYDQVPWFWSDQYDIKLQTAGLLTGFDEVVIRGDISTTKFSVFYLQNGKLLAVDAINSPAEFMVAKNLIINQISLNKEVIMDLSIKPKEFINAMQPA